MQAKKQQLELNTYLTVRNPFDIDALLLLLLLLPPPQPLLIRFSRVRLCATS